MTECGQKTIKIKEQNINWGNIEEFTVLLPNQILKIYTKQIIQKQKIGILKCQCTDKDVFNCFIIPEAYGKETSKLRDYKIQ